MLFVQIQIDIGRSQTYKVKSTNIRNFQSQIHKYDALPITMDLNHNLGGAKKLQNKIRIVCFQKQKYENAANGDLKDH